LWDYPDTIRDRRGQVKMENIQLVRMTVHGAGTSTHQLRTHDAVEMARRIVSSPGWGETSKIEIEPISCPPSKEAPAVVRASNKRTREADLDSLFASVSGAVSGGRVVTILPKTCW